MICALLDAVTPTHDAAVIGRPMPILNNAVRQAFQRNPSPQTLTPLLTSLPPQTAEVNAAISVVPSGLTSATQLAPDTTSFVVLEVICDSL